MCAHCADDLFTPADRYTTTVDAAAAWQALHALPADDERPSARELKEDER